MGLMTTFHCLRFENLPTWWARSPYLYPAETGCPNYTPRHWVPFSPPPTTHRAIVDVFKPAFMVTISQHRQCRKRLFQYSSLLWLLWIHAFLWSHYLAMAVVQLLVLRLLPSNGSTCHIMNVTCKMYRKMWHSYAAECTEYG
jgi:hypothetical protein